MSFKSKLKEVQSKIKDSSTEEILGKVQDAVNTVDTLNKSLPTPLRKHIGVAVGVLDLVVGATVAIRKVLGRQ